MRRIVAGISVALLVAIVVSARYTNHSVLAQAQPAACAPLQMSDIEEYVGVKAPVAVVRRRVGDCGLGFTFDKAAEDRLRAIGAPADLIAMLANVGRSGLDVRSTPPGATVTIDGQRRGTTPLVLNDLAPGTHKVLLSLPGHLDNASEVATKAGDTTRVERTLTPSTTQTAPVTPAAQQKGGSKLPWIIGGVAAVGGGAAIALAGGGGGDPPASTTTAPVACTITLASTNLSFGFAGGTQSVQLTTNSPTCTWSFSGLPSWLTAAPGNGTGSTSITFTATANIVDNGSSQSRTSGFTVGSTNVTANQEGLTCANTVATRDNLNGVGNGGTVNAPDNDRFFTIQTAGECRWTASTSTSWMFFRQNGATTISGTGPRLGEGSEPNLRVVFQANTGGRRTGTITVASTTFSVLQCAVNETSC